MNAFLNLKQIINTPSNMVHITTENVVFTWVLENFSMCPLKKGESLKSPFFQVGTQKTKWYLSLSPKGDDDDDFIGCCLCRDDDTGPAEITIGCQFSFVIAEGVSEYGFESTRYKYSKSTDEYHELMEITELFKKNLFLLPRDTLTIRCRLSGAKFGIEKVDSTESVKALVGCLYEEEANASAYKVPEEMHAMASHQISDIKRKFFPCISEYSARIRFEVERRRFTWPIKNISSFTPGQKVSVQLLCNSEKAPSFILSFSFKGSDESGVMDIRILDEKETKKIISIYVVCRLVILNINGGEHLAAENEKHFESKKQDEVWSIPTFFTKKKLINHKSLRLPNDTLYMVCTFKISRREKNYASDFEEYNFASLAPETYTSANDMEMMVEDFKSFYNNKKHFDVELRVEGETLQAHKAVLCSRSAVFSAIYEEETAEKISNVLTIPDVDAKTFAQMLSFMYTDSVKNLKCESAIKLYSAADKYQVISLKKKCSSYLKSILNVVNVYNILILADSHQDKELRDAAQNFLFEPPYEAFLSSEFEKLIDCNSSLARSTLRGWINKWKSDLVLNSV